MRWNLWNLLKSSFQNGEKGKHFSGVIKWDFGGNQTMQMYSNFEGFPL